MKKSIACNRIHRTRSPEMLERRLLLTGSDYSEVTPAWFDWVDAPAQPVRAAAAAQGFVGPRYVGEGPSPNETRWIVRLSEEAVQQMASVPAATSLFDTDDVSLRVVRGLGLPGQLLVESSDDRQKTAASLESNPNVASFEQDTTVRGQKVPDTNPDPFFDTDQLALNNEGQFGGEVNADINAPEAWDRETGEATVVVGVIDSGIDLTHPDLYKNIWLNQGELPQFVRDRLTEVDTDDDGLVTFWDLNDPNNLDLVLESNPDLPGPRTIDAEDILNDPAWADGRDTDNNGFVDDFFGWNFVGDDGTFAPNHPGDALGHGTHVAGIIGAMGDNGIGITGVNWKTSMMSLKFLNENNEGSTSDAVLALNYATMMRNDFDVNIRVTNNSWGQTGGFNENLLQAVEDSGEAGILFVAAAGNGNILGRGINNDVNAFYPANYEAENAISVAASTPSDSLATFSNFGGETVDLAAPGTSIFSTLPGGNYGASSGTSMAAPHVTGVAALVWSDFPDASTDEVRTAILGGDAPANTPGQLQGLVRAGRLDGAIALASSAFAPRARLVEANDITLAGGTGNTITVEFSDRQGLKASSIDGDEIVVTRGWGPKDPVTVTLVGESVVALEGGKKVTATYEIAAPGGTWDPLDFGAYQLSVVEDSAFSNAGRSALSGSLGKFNVKIEDPSFFYVDSTAAETLRGAVEEANEAGEPRTIILDTGRFVAADLAIRGDITIAGADASTTIIDADSLGRGFEVDSGAKLQLDRLTLKNGKATEREGGGGVLNNGTLIVRDSELTGNVASYGGAIENSGLLTVNRSVISDNRADGQSFWAGGVWVDNDIVGGGGIRTAGSAATIADTTISGNFASHSGGGIEIRSGNVTIERSTVSDNRAFWELSAGVAVRACDAPLPAQVTVTNTTIANNDGQGFTFCGKATTEATLDSVTVSGNMEGIVRDFDNEAQLRLRNTFAAGNVGEADLKVSEDNFTSLGHNLIGSAFMPNKVASAAEFGGDGDQLVPEAGDFLGPLQDNGGATFTQALLPGSAAIDAGPPLEFPPVDQRGELRPVADDNGGRADIGAFERVHAEISGRIFHDLDADRAEDPNEPGLAGRTVFLDENDNGILDPGERSTITLDDDPLTARVVERGQFSFPNLEAGIYDVAQVVEPGWQQTIAGPGEVELVSRVPGESGTSPDLGSMDSTGRFATFSFEKAEDGFFANIYVRDRRLGTVQLVSAGRDNMPSNGRSYGAVISGNGDFVAFESQATNLVPGAPNPERGLFDSDVFFFDRTTEQLKRISNGFNGDPANASSRSPAISDDGRYVVFESDATNLVPGDTNAQTDVFLHDTMEGTTRLISTSFDGNPTNGDSMSPSISGDGSTVIFNSSADNLVSDDSKTGMDMFVYDTRDESLTRINLDAVDEQPVESGIYRPAISADGNLIAFYSRTKDIVVYDRENGAIERVGYLHDEHDITNPSPSLSADGRFVSFISDVADLVPGDTNNLDDAFFYDRTAKTLERLSVSSVGAQANIGIVKSVISPNGRFVAFWSRASNLVPGDSNNQYDVFVRSTPAAGETTSHAVELVAGQINTAATFGTRPQDGTITGIHFDDIVPNGVRDPGEPGIAGWTVFADTNLNGVRDSDEPFAVTDVDGVYSLDNLVGNTTYTIVSVAQADREVVAPAKTTDNDGRNAWKVFVDAGETVTDRDFASRAILLGGKSRESVISGVVYEESSIVNGTQDAGEVGLPGRTVFLDLNNDGLRQFNEPQTTTDADGKYRLDNLGIIGGAVRLADSDQDEQTTPRGNLLLPGDTLEIDVAGLTDGITQADTLLDTVTGDFNGDGFDDVAISSGGSTLSSKSRVYLFLNSGTGTFQKPVEVDLSVQGVGSMVAGHFNNNEKLDLAVLHTTAGKMSVLLDFDPATPNFNPPKLIDVGTLPTGIARIPSKTGPDELVITREAFAVGSPIASAAAVVLLRNDGNGNFTAQPTLDPQGDHPGDVVVGHFNNDDVLDLAVSHFGDLSESNLDGDKGHVEVFLADGKGGYGAGRRYDQDDHLGNAPTGIAVGDFNGDQINDLAIANFYSNNVTILTGNRDGTFVGSPKYVLANGESPLDISATDLEGDGDVDLVVTGATNEQGNITIHRNRLNQGEAIFEPAQVSPVANLGRGGLTPFTHDVGDFNKDDIADFVVANSLSGEMLVVMNSVVNGTHSVSVDGVSTVDGRDFGLAPPPQNRKPTLDEIPTIELPQGRVGAFISLTGISAGGDEQQPLQIQDPRVLGGNANLITDVSQNYTSPDPQGGLIVLLDRDESGFAIVSVTVTDGGLDGNLETDGDNASIEQLFRIVVTAS